MLSGIPHELDKYSITERRKGINIHRQKLQIINQRKNDYTGVLSSGFYLDQAHRYRHQVQVSSANKLKKLNKVNEDRSLRYNLDKIYTRPNCKNCDKRLQNFIDMQNKGNTYKRKIQLNELINDNLFYKSKLSHVYGKIDFQKIKEDSDLNTRIGFKLRRVHPLGLKPIKLMIESPSMTAINGKNKELSSRNYPLSACSSENLQDNKRISKCNSTASMSSRNFKKDNKDTKEVIDASSH